ncbi:hypothetical protein [Occultella kanbiaonis]|uniref:hypothetical protein n=1 Tax=Occultella kanbiaonis TaxID=2675754 RepID=UPI0012B90770|nr:hypothetical protein [Occultella kanbiaonis]
MHVRPATTADVETSRGRFDDLLPDRWRGGNNRRSFVAVDPDGRVLGHCRGIDNDFHPASRVLVLEVLPDVEQVPGPEPGGSWTAIVAIGVPGGRVPVPLPCDLLPEGAAWIRRMAQPGS